MTAAADSNPDPWAIARGAPVTGLRHVLDSAGWSAFAAALAGRADPWLLAMWADTAQVHALLQNAEGVPLLVSGMVDAGWYAALSPHRPAAALFERAVHDLWGHSAAGGTDSRPWLDHGDWPVLRPMSARPVPHAGVPEFPEFHEVPDAGDAPDGLPLPQIALGPVQAGDGAPAHLRISVAGNTMVRLEARLGYAHKGTLLLMRGKSPRAAARLAARLDGEATVAHSTAFARAAEAACGAEIPPRAAALRDVAGALERVAMHLHDLGGLCAAAGARHPGLRFGWHREALLQASHAAFGHRLMMDCVVPGGVAADIAVDGPPAILAALDALTMEWPTLLRATIGDSGLADRLAGLGALTAETVGSWASGRPGLARGSDVGSRLRAMLDAVAAGAGLLRAALPALPPGAVGIGLPPGNGEGLGRSDTARGACWHWLRVDAGQVAACFAVDPGWMLWPLLEHAAQGAALADLELIRRSLAPTVSGMDL